MQYLNPYRYRLLLAAIHNNYNANRDQKKTADGSDQFRVSYPKFRGGDGVVKPVKEVCYGKLQMTCIMTFVSINLYICIYNYIYIIIYYV